MWSRSTGKEPPAQPPASPAASFFSNHQRGASSGAKSSAGSSIIGAGDKGKGKLRKKAPGGQANGTLDEGSDDEDVWAEDSDDEQSVAALAASQRKLANLAIANQTGDSTSNDDHANGAKEAAASSASSSSLAMPTLRSVSSWSFNPFSAISQSPKSPESAPLPALAGPEAVAAVLAGATIAAAPVSSPRVKKSTELAPGPRIVDKDSTGPTEDDSAAEETAEGDRPDAQRRGSGYQMEQWKAAIKPDVEEIVKDPVSLLSRLNLCPPPPPATSTPRHAKSLSSSTNRRESLGVDDVQPADDDDEDEDPAAGYVPLNALNLSSGAPEIVEFGKEEETVEDMGERGREKRRRSRFIDCLGAESVDLTELRKLAWAGIPNELRPMSWQLLLGYLPAPASRRLPTLARKRQEYADAVRLAFSRGVPGLDGPIWHQISIDVPRTNPGVRLWQGEATQRSLERILYVWAIRHPASGYVQGINDLVTPFFEVFLSSYITDDPETYDVSALPPAVLEALEADSFWCLSKLLDGIQDNYIFAQPGIVRQVARMRELCSRVDAPLAYHLEENNVEFMQFAFRWVNCLLMREMSVTNIIRMWDTYLAEGADAFSEFHLYVCLAFLVKWSEQLRGMDFQSIIMFLQSLPTRDWTDKNTELLLSEAFMWSRTFEAR